MFSSLLYTPVKVGEKVFHVLCDNGINIDDLEKFGVEVIKISNDLRAQAATIEKKEPEQEKPEEEKSEEDLT